MTDIILKHLIFFLGGILQDLFITYYYQAIAKEHAWKAAFLSSSVTLVNLLILYEILAGIQNQILSVILAYALGNGVGTLIIMKKHQIKKYFGKKIP
jgi:hypothetical protein